MNPTGQINDFVCPFGLRGYHVPERQRSLTTRSPHV
jgi:hypothetical protein